MKGDYCMKKVLILLSAIFVLAFAVNAQTVSLKTDFQDTSSKVVQKSDGSFGGICVDLMKLVEGNSNYKFIRPTSFTPLKRIEDDLEKGSIDVYFALLKNAEREKKCSFIVPIYTIKYILVAREDDKTVIKTIDDLKKINKDLPILTVSGSTIMNYIATLGLKGDDSGKTVEQNFDKIIGKRADYFIYHDIAILSELSSAKYKGKLKVYPLTLQSEEMWLVTALNLEPKIKDDLKNTVNKLKKSGEWDKVIKTYISN